MNLIFRNILPGTFYYCTGTNLVNITTKADCLGSGNSWINKKYNFDDLGQALMSLFVLSSKDGWVGIMYSGLDAVGVDIQVGGEELSPPFLPPANLRIFKIR